MRNDPPKPQQQFRGSFRWWAHKQMKSIGYYHCWMCKTFKCRQDFMPARFKTCRGQLCRACNAARQHAYYQTPAGRQASLKSRSTPKYQEQLRAAKKRHLAKKKAMEALYKAHWEAVNKQLDAENWDYRSDRDEPEGKL